MRRGTVATILCSAALYGGVLMFAPRGHAPELHIGTTVRTEAQIIQVGSDRWVGAYMQYYINDGRDRLDYLTVAFRVSDDDLQEVTLRDNGQVIYHSDLEDIAGTVYGDVRYDAAHSGRHELVLEARDGSHNLRTFSAVTEGNRIISIKAPADGQSPMVTFADKDDAWYERFGGEGYVGKAHVSDRSDFLLGGGQLPPMYGFSSHVFDEDLERITLEVNGNQVFDRVFEERDYDGRRIREPAEVQFGITVPKGSGSYSIRIFATDSEGRRTVEERVIEAKP